MAITFGDAKKRVAQWAGRGGKCASNAEVALFLREVLDYMLISGQYGNLRKFVFNAVNGSFTVPYELESILKVKIDGAIASSWDRWFEWYGYSDLSDCIPANAVLEEPNYVPTAYDIPGVANVGVQSICEEDPNAHVIIKGLDATGREVITDHKGEQLVGEYLSIRKGQIRVSHVAFSKITEVVKTKTNGYVQLYWIKGLEKGFLSDYSPFEQYPKYRRYKIKIACAPNARVEVLGRIRLKEYYSDNDLIPFDNLYALSLAAQAIYSNYNNNPETAIAKDTQLRDIIIRENETKNVNNGKPVEMFVPLAGGSIKNIIF
jgi:hypothetical protein